MAETAESFPPQSTWGKQPFNWRLFFAILGGVLLLVGLLLAVPIFMFIAANRGIQKGGIYQVDLKQLGSFDFNEYTGTINDIPQQFRKLDGKQISLEGFIAPTSISDAKIKDFEFVYNVTPREGRGPPKVQERVFAHFVKGTIDYSDAEIRITGNLHVSLHKDPDTGKIIQVYTMDVSRADPL